MWKCVIFALVMAIYWEQNFKSLEDRFQSLK